MNTQKLDLLTTIFEGPDLNENVLSIKTGYPQFRVEQLLEELIQEGFLRKDRTLVDDTMIELKRLRNVNEEAFGGNLEILTLIGNVFHIDRKSIKNIIPMDKGMTNYSFKFDVKNKTYIMRVPGVGTDEMVNREEEYEVYKELEGRNMTDNVIFIDPKTGYKITEFIKDVRTCDPNRDRDVKLSMDKLKELHEAKIKVDHRFDLFEKIEHYESLRNGKPSIYKDYLETKKKMYDLKTYIDSIPKKSILTHIDPVADNFLIIGNDVRLIDWEYAGMQDPNLDLAMFALYASYDKNQIDNLLDIYAPDGYSDSTKISVYSYMALAGFLWSNWCEYKSMLGVDFGDYAEEQYSIAKEFYKIAKSEMSKLEGNVHA